MNDYITKPIQVEQLVEALNKCTPGVAIQKGDDAKKSKDAKSKQKPQTSILAPVNQENGKVLDLAILAKLKDMIGGDDEVFVELIDTFLEDAD